MGLLQNEQAFDATYRKVHSIFSGIPKRYSIPIGKMIYRIMPVPYTEMRWQGFERKIGETEFQNPLVLGSYYSEPWMWRSAFCMGFGAVTTKTTTIQERKGNPHPRVVGLGRGFVNCESYPNPGKAKMTDRIQGFTENYEGNGVLIGSLTGSRDEVNEIAQAISPYVECIELNLSCPNYGLTYELYSNPEKMREIMEAAKKSGRPVILKISRDFNEKNFSTVIRMAIEIGIDAIHYANTKLIEEKRLSMGKGGYSGPELYYDTLEYTKKIRQTFGPGIKIIAGGGINSPERAERLLEHADFISYLSAFITEGPTFPRKIKRRMAKII